MSFDHDIESAVREAIRRGGHADYNYNRLSRRQVSLEISVPGLGDVGPDLAIVVELSAAAASEYVDEAQEAVGRALRQDTVRSLAVIGPETWAEWATEHWETRPHGTLEAEHIEAHAGEGLTVLEDLEKEPSAIVVIVDRDPIWPDDLDPTNLVLIVIPQRLADGRLTTIVSSPPVDIAECVEVLTSGEEPPVVEQKD